jgi:carboxyl-terminal processing protease
MTLTTITGRFRALAGATAACLLVAAAPAQTFDDKPEAKTEVLESISRRLMSNAFIPGVDFAQLKVFLEKEMAKIDESKTDQEFARALNLALSNFGASHIVVTTPQQAEMRRTNATVGIGISSQETEQGLVIVRVIPGAPADEAGMVPGDVIIEVEGEPVQGIRGIPGPENTQVTVKVRRADGEVKEMTMTRRKFSTKRPEELHWIDEDTARLVVHTFDLSYDRLNVEKLMAEANAKAKNLILDMRDNGGGAVIHLQHLLGLFMNPEQPIGTFISRPMVDDYVKKTGGSATDLAAIGRWSTDKIRPARNRNLTPFKGNVYVLVNQASGSAAEIAAAALQETVGAKVIGAKSAGAVLVSIIVPVGHGFQLQYPINDYVTLRGRRLEGNGVLPDVAAQDSLPRLPTARDESVEAAISLIVRNRDAARASAGGNGSGQANSQGRRN